MVKNRIITDPDDAKLNPKDWFIYPTSSVMEAATIEATLFEKSLSTQLAQILACGGYFIGTEDMVAWKNTIRVLTDEPRLAKIADDYKIKAHVLFWVSLGFADMECPAPSATQFIQYYMHKAQSSFCIKAIYGTSNLGGTPGGSGNFRDPGKGKNKRKPFEERDHGDDPPTKILKHDNDTTKLNASTLPRASGKTLKNHDLRVGTVPAVWLQHVRQFPAVYNTTVEKLMQDSNISPKCACGVGGGSHSSDACMSRLVVNKWGHTKLTEASTKADIQTALSKLKQSKGIKERK